jgi:hypothetical protein
MAADSDLGLLNRAWQLDAAGGRDVIRKNWFRDLDSNQDTQLQRLMSYRLDDPGIAEINCSRGKQAGIDGATHIDEMRRRYGGEGGIDIPGSGVGDWPL